MTYIDLLPERFTDKIEIDPNGCWLWLGATKASGHAQYRHEGRTQAAHRVAYLALVGPVPDGLELDHLCRAPACVNPAHLEPVTHRENLLRGRTIAATNAAKTHCPHGHPYDAANTYISRRGSRICVECRKLGLRALTRRRKGANS